MEAAAFVAEEGAIDDEGGDADRKIVRNGRLIRISGRDLSVASAARVAFGLVQG